MTVKIRQANKDDWKIIQELNNQVFLNDKNNDDDLNLNWPYSPKGIKYYKDIAGSKWAKCLIAFFGNKPVGYIALAPKNWSYRKSKYVEIENMGVDREYRSQGIGKQLIEKAVKWAKKQKATKMYVSVYWKNKRAIDFYEKNGFYEIEVGLDKNI